MSKIKISFLFTFPKNPKWTSHLIRKVIGTDYSHVVTVVPTGPVGTLDVYQASNGDCNLVELNNFLEYNHVIKKVNIDIEKEPLLNMVRFLKKQCGKKYSVLGAIAAGLPYVRKFGWGKDGDKSFICSELSLRGLEEAYGVQIFRNDDWVDPEAFEQLLDRIKKGEISYE